MTHNGLMIAIEGKDESESQIQLDLLTKNLKKFGLNTITISFPKSEETSSYFINQLNNNEFGNKEDVGPYTSSIFYAIDRYSSLIKIQEALANDQVVVVSNFTMSTAAKEGKVFEDIRDFNDYLMWLKAVENRMLGLPEPNISIILNSLNDLDENDQLIKRNFDHIASISPDKYREVGYKRDSKVLTTEEIQNIIFEIAKPLLPEPNYDTLETKNNKTDDNRSSSNDQIVIKNLSHNLITQIQTFSFSPKLEVESSDLRFYTPDFYNEQSKEKYNEFIKKIRKIYKDTYEKLINSKLSDKEIKIHLDQILPLSRLSDISIPNDGNSIKNLVLALNQINSPESEKVLDKLLSKFDIEKPKSNPKNKTQSKLDSLVANGYGSSTEPTVTLINVYPRNEFDLIAEFLYPTATMPYKHVKKELDNWTYDNKSSILRLYLNNHLSDSEYLDSQLDNTIYNLELITSQKILNNIINKKIVKKVNYQTISPRLGYKIPDQFKNLDIDENIEECFDLSLETYSELQALDENFALEFCCLLGNQVRYQIIVNIHQLHNLNKYLKTIGETGISQSIIDQISLNHPIISESIK